MRLDKLLTVAGYGSRNKIKTLLKSYQVKLDGQVVTTANTNVDPVLQDVTVSGQKVRYEAEVYYILNKPAGVVTARTDSNYQTVIDLISPEDRREGLYPVGRLDRDTEGLVLITNNGPLGFRMLHPKYHVSKTYYVEVNDLLDDDAPNFFANGITFHDGTICKSANLEILNATSEKSGAYITISEGKFHQVKKMFLAYGVKVIYLKRICFGGFVLDDNLKSGDYRFLTENEKEMLKKYLN